MRGRVWKKALGSYDYGKVLNSGDVVPAQVRVHLILVSRVETTFPEQGQRMLRWCSASEAAEAVDEGDLKKLLRKVPDEVAKLHKRAFKQSGGKQLDAHSRAREQR